MFDGNARFCFEYSESVGALQNKKTLKRVSLASDFEFRRVCVCASENCFEKGTSERTNLYLSKRGTTVICFDNKLIHRIDFICQHFCVHISRYLSLRKEWDVFGHFYKVHPCVSS